jgi:hypothetical protein
MTTDEGRPEAADPGSRVDGGQVRPEYKSPFASLKMNDILAAHKHSSRHRAEILSSTQCGCFHCLANFPQNEIKDWVDWQEGTPEDSSLIQGQPRCVHTAGSIP